MIRPFLIVAFIVFISCNEKNDNDAICRVVEFYPDSIPKVKFCHKPSFPTKRKYLKYYRSGNLKIIENHNDWKLNGLTTSYYDSKDSLLKYQGNYINNKRVGEHVWRYENGNFKARYWYDNNGHEILKYEFKEDGSFEDSVSVNVVSYNDTVKIRDEYQANVFFGTPRYDSIKVKIDLIKILDLVEPFNEPDFKLTFNDFYYTLTVKCESLGRYEYNGTIVNVNRKTGEEYSYPFNENFLVIE